MYDYIACPHSDVRKVEIRGDVKTGCNFKVGELLSSVMDVDCRGLWKEERPVPRPGRVGAANPRNAV